MKLYNHFNLNNMKTAIKKHEEGWSMREIGKYLGFNVSTISRQLKRVEAHKWSPRVHSWAKKVIFYDWRQWNHVSKDIKKKRTKKLNTGLENKYDKFAKEMVNKRILNKIHLYFATAIIFLFTEEFDDLSCPKKSQLYNLNQ